MKPLLTILAIYFISFKATAQLTQETWMIGGSGIFSSSKDVFSGRDYTLTIDTPDIKISSRRRLLLYKRCTQNANKGVSNVNWFTNSPGKKMKTIKVYKKYFL